MANLNLQPNESIIMKGIRVYHGEGMFPQYNDDLFLTNLNIILISKGVYGNGTKTTSYPINQIKVYNGKAQVILGRSRNLIPQIEIFFMNGHETFGFMNKSDAVKWVDNINILLTGKEADPESKKMSGIPGTDLVTSVLSDTFGAMKDAISSKSRSTSVSPDVKVTIKCLACGAPLSGNTGQNIRCKYCDTEQTL